MERALLRSGARVVVGMDEVGRGALAGPVTVGAVAVDLTTRTCPQGVADSKLLTAASRERLLPALGRWGLARGVGHAGPDEIDRLGIIAALRLAGRRAVAALGVEVDLVLLDGSHDWLTTPAELDLFGEDSPAAAVDPWSRIAVRTRVKADQRCASVAAASILAKCRRDALMTAHAHDHPAYGWAENKGYGAPEHVEALRRLGPSPLHRTSWRLPTADDVEDGVVEELADVVDALVDVAGHVEDDVVGTETGGRDGTDGRAGSGVPDADERRGWAMMDA
nr:ribonuclease HII [Actinotalea sp. Marseille-Q4924]